MQRRIAFIVFAVALLTRLVVAASFHGSIDIDIEIEAAGSIMAGITAWSTKLPIGYFLPALMHLLSSATGIPESVAQKLPAIAGDLLAGFLIWRYVRKGNSERAWLLPAIYLLNPVTIMLSAYHGNVDPLMAAVMFGALMLRWKEQRFASGVTLAIAVAMKPTAILMLPVLVLPLTAASAFSVGVPAVLLPIAAMMPFALRDERARTYLLTYPAPYGKWGFSLILKQLENVSRQLASIHGHFLDALAKLNAELLTSGKYILIAVLLVWFVCLFLWRSRIATFEAAAAAAAATFLVFYVFTFGFGVQYFSLALPFLLVASTRLAVVYSIVVTPVLAGTYVQEQLQGSHGAAVTESLRSLSRSDLALLFANGIVSVAGWLTCAWILWRLVAAIRTSHAPTPET